MTTQQVRHISEATTSPIPTVCPHEVKPPNYLGEHLRETLDHHRGVTCGSTNIKGPFWTVKSVSRNTTDPMRVTLVRSWFCADCQENGEQLFYGSAISPAVRRAVTKDAMIDKGADPKWFAPAPVPEATRR